MSRYVQTGEARILNTTRSVVGLTKGHSMFPITLNVIKLNGAGDEATFLGVVRPACAESQDIVRLWVAPSSGLILTADETCSDQFGLVAAELVGRCLSTLGPDIEVLEK